MIKRVTVFSYTRGCCNGGVPTLRISTSEVSSISNEFFGVGHEEYDVDNFSEWTSIIHKWLDSLPKLLRGQREIVTVEQCYFFDFGKDEKSFEHGLLERILAQREDVQIIDYWKSEKMFWQAQLYAETMGRWSPD